MPDFAWRGIDVEGRERTGRVAAANDAAARARLARQRLHIIAVEPAASEARTVSVTAILRRTPKLGLKQLTLFTRQLSSLVQVSPLEEALRTASLQTESMQVRAILGNVHSGVVEGQRLSEAMRREEASFPPLYRAMVSAGESSGALPEILLRLATLLERRAAINSKLLSALAYPLILTLVATLVVSALMISVVPRVVEQFDDVNQQLPLITQIVIGVSAFLAAYWWLLLLALAFIVGVFAALLRRETVRLRVDSHLLRLPFLGRLIRDLNAARLSRTLATMVSSRLPLLDGLRLTRDTIGNRALRKANNMMIEQVRGGGSLSGAMRATGVFPPLLVYLAASGESAGQLDIMLERAADYLEREFDDFTATALSLLEPLIIVMMGGVVAVIILSILLPILQLQNLAGL
ncbi:MAG: type II secretion system inner membrane protein GspF [Sphingobium sp.]|nr:MAG: type II secretion system inner membrane protein GspF [Sphingobium sp.]